MGEDTGMDTPKPEAGQEPDATAELAFGPGFDQVVSRADGGTAVFGRNVLDALIAPLKEAAARRRTERQWGPGVLGCAMWMDDPELIDVLRDMANVCVVITKQQPHTYKKPAFARLEELASSNGLSQRAFSDLEQLAPLVDGKPQVVGPYGYPAGDGSEIGAVRELGFRKVGNRLVPIVHAKMLLMGRMGWTDEHPSGHVMDILYFVPERLWVGSANFTANSRQSLEMGLWTTEPELLEAARDWLLRLVANSEPLRSASDDSSPELVPVDYDEVAIAEYLRETDFDYDALVDDF